MNREQIIEAMAWAVCESKHGNTWGVALDALCYAIPGLADVIAGKAVVVLVEPDDGCIIAMRLAMKNTRTPGVSGQTNDAVFKAEYAKELAAYRAMIEARPK